MPASKRPVRRTGNGFKLGGSMETILHKLDFEDLGTLELEVWKDRFTLGMQKKMQRAAEQNDIATVADIFFQQVKSWNVEDEDGNPLPLDPEIIDEVMPINTFFAISQKLADLQNPNSSTSTST